MGQEPIKEPTRGSPAVAAWRGSRLARPDVESQPQQKSQSEQEPVEKSKP
jgi:hypothetical protein